MFFFCSKRKTEFRSVDSWARRKKIMYQTSAQHSLQVLIPPGIAERDSGIRGRASLFTFRSLRASLTVEAALSMTLFLLLITALLNFFSVIHTQIRVQTALELTGEQLAAWPEEASLITAEILFQTNLESSGLDVSMILGGKGGLSIGRSSVMGREAIIDLVATYQMRLPLVPEGVADIRVIQRSRKRAFGNVIFPGQEKQDYVYITPSGEVYHENLNCTYIRPVTEEVSYQTISSLRNKNGEAYDRCAFCKTNEPVSTVWVTKWGNCFHVASSCRGLWHNVEQIERSKVMNRRACSKCGTEQKQTEE